MTPTTPTPSPTGKAATMTARDTWPTADELAEMSMHDQEMWERRCAEAEARETPPPTAGTETTDG